MFGESHIPYNIKLLVTMVGGGKKCVAIDDGVKCTKGARSGYDTCTSHGGRKKCVAIDDGVC